MTYDNNDYWTRRRTIRRYSDREVSEEMLDDIIEKASHAPTTGNMQLYSVIVTRDPEAIKELAPAHFNQPAATGATALLTFCADFNRFCHWCDISDADHGYDNFQSFMTAVLDTAIFTQQFVTIAEQQGLGCCYLGTTTYNAPQIAKRCNSPKESSPYALYPSAGRLTKDSFPTGFRCELYSTASATTSLTTPKQPDIMPIRKACPKAPASSRKTERKLSHRFSPTYAIRARTMNTSLPYTTISSKTTVSHSQKNNNIVT